MAKELAGMIWMQLLPFSGERNMQDVEIITDADYPAVPGDGEVFDLTMREKLQAAMEMMGEHQVLMMDVTDKLIALQVDRAQLVAFAKRIVERSDGGRDLTGADVQDAAVEFGLMIKAVASAPCGDDCTCNDVVEFPVECYKLSRHFFGAFENGG